MKKNKRALIVNQANWEGISRLPYLLFLAGFLVDVISPEDNFIAHSSFLEKHYPVPDHTESVIDFLRDHLSLYESIYDQVIIGDDPLLCALCKISNEAWVRKVIPCNINNSSIAFISSKIEFITQAYQYGIRVPDFEICANQGQLNSAVARLGFPVILKKSEGFGGISLFFLKNQREFDNFKITETLIAQKFIEGKTVSAQVLYDHGIVGAYYSYYRHRTWGSFGITTAAKFRRFQELDQILKTLGEISGFHGICGVDLMEEDKSGKLYLLEQNFRPTQMILIGKHVGVNFAEIIKNNPDGLKLNIPIKQNEESNKVVALFPSDVFRALDKIDFFGLLRWILFPAYWCEVCWYDLKLLFFNLKTIIKFAKDKFVRNFQRFFKKYVTLNMPQ